MRGTVKIRRAAQSNRGSVLVLVGVALPVLVLFVSLAVDFAHFFDYSRNLQNRADAAALAAGSQLGGTCFGTPSATGLDNIGETAQQYSGPLAGADVPYNATAMQGRTSYNLPNLKAGDGAHLHVLLNSTQNWPGGGDWTLGSATTAGSDASFCDAGTENGVALGATADVRITQDQLPLFFPLLGFKPRISAHARIQIQGSSSPSGVRPIAVPDPAQTPCLRAIVVDDATGNPILDAGGNPVNVAMTPPSGANVFWTAQLPAINVPGKQLSAEAYIPDDCNNPAYPTGGTLYDSNNGLVFINTYQNYNPATITAPAVGSVWLEKAGCDDPTESAAQDPYFYYFPKSANCRVVVHATADVQPGKTGTFTVSMDGGAAVAMDANGTDAGNRHMWVSHTAFNIPTQSGRHTFVISWSTGNGNNNNGDFNGGAPLQATYAALSDGSDPPDDSGPVTQAEIGDTAGDEVNSVLQGSSQTTLTVAFHLQGLELSQPADPPIILRAAVQNSKKTGALDCGQGNGAQALETAIEQGCPHAVSIFQPAQGCVVLPNANPITCASLVPGNRRNMVMNGFENRIESINSPCDNWQAYKNAGTAISGFETPDGTQNPPPPAVPDPRIFILVVTAPGDLSGNVNTGPLRILGFATFYVTGWDGDPWLPNGNGHGNGNTIPGCDAATHSNVDEPYPGTGTDKFQVWGHFIKYVAAGGTPNGNPCNPNDPSVCVPALTR